MNTNKKLISKLFDNPTKQKENYTCGYYALAQCMEAKAKIKKLIDLDDEIDSSQLVAMGGVGEPLFSLNPFLRKEVKTKKGKSIMLSLYQKILDYSSDPEKNDLDLVKSLIDLNCAVMIAIVARGRKYDTDKKWQYIYDESRPIFRHWVPAFDYDKNFIYLSDSANGAITKIANDDFDKLTKSVYVINVSYTETCFIHPIKDVHVTQEFGKNKEYYKKFGGQWTNGHMGVDYRTKTKDNPSGIGTPILASHKGIIKCSSSPSYGNYIEIEHWKDTLLVTRYCHLSEFKKKDGELVEQGEIIALSGNTGNSTAPHLHFELIHDGIFLDFEVYRNIKDLEVFK